MGANIHTHTHKAPTRLDRIRIRHLPDLVVFAFPFGSVCLVHSPMFAFNLARIMFAHDGNRRLVDALPSHPVESNASLT